MCDLLLHTLPDRTLAALCLAASLSAWPAAVSPLLAAASPACRSEPDSRQAEQHSSLQRVLHAIACDLAAEEPEHDEQGSPETAAACSQSTQGSGPGQLASQARACLQTALGPVRDRKALEGTQLLEASPWSHVNQAAGEGRRVRHDGCTSKCRVAARVFAVYVVQGRC